MVRDVGFIIKGTALYKGVWNDGTQHPTQGLQTQCKSVARVLMLAGGGTYLPETFQEGPDLDECLSDDELAQFRLARKIISDAYKLIKETAMPPEILVDMPPPLTALDQAILELQYAQRDPNPVSW